MKKIRIFVLAFLSLSVLFSMAGCGYGYHEKKDPAREKAMAAYIDGIQADAEAYFLALTEAVDVPAPDNIRLNFPYADIEFFQEAPRPIEELMKPGTPMLRVGLNRASGESFQEEEIHAILKEAFTRGLIVDFYFDYNDHYLYRVQEDRVYIDRALPADGGAMRETEPYEL